MRYLVRERIFSITDDFWVTDAHGNDVFLVDGKALRIRETFELKDASGQLLATIRKKLLAFTDTLEIERGRLEAVGNLVDHDFEIRDGHQLVAQVSRSWFRIRDTYGVDIAPGENDALFVCIAICLDRIHHDEEERRR